MKKNSLNTGDIANSFEEVDFMSAESNKKIEALLNEFMNEIPDIEGLILSKTDGSLIVAQTIYPDLDDDLISKSAVNVAESTNMLSKTVEKGGVKELNIEFSDGFCLITSKDEFVLSVVAGSDARSQLGLIKMNLHKTINTIRNVISD